MKYADFHAMIRYQWAEKWRGSREACQRNQRRELHAQEAFETSRAMPINGGVRTRMDRFHVHDLSGFPFADELELRNLDNSRPDRIQKRQIPNMYDIEARSDTSETYIERHPLRNVEMRWQGRGGQSLRPREAGYLEDYQGWYQFGIRRLPQYDPGDAQVEGWIDRIQGSHSHPQGVAPIVEDQ